MILLFLSQIHDSIYIKDIWTASSEFGIIAYASSESRGTFREKARSLAPLNGWACAVEICHDGLLEDTNSLDGAHMVIFLDYAFFHRKVRLPPKT